MGCHPGLLESKTFRTIDDGTNSKVAGNSSCPRQILTRLSIPYLLPVTTEILLYHVYVADNFHSVVKCNIMFCLRPHLVPRFYSLMANMVIHLFIPCRDTMYRINFKHNELPSSQSFVAREQVLP